MFKRYESQVSICVEGVFQILSLVRPGDRGKTLVPGPTGWDHADRDRPGALFAGRVPHSTQDLVAADPFIHFFAIPDATLAYRDFCRDGTWIDRSWVFGDSTVPC